MIACSEICDLVKVSFKAAVGKKIVVKLTLVGSDDPYTLKLRKLGFLFSKFLKYEDLFIAISPKLKELSLKANVSEEKITSIPNGIDLEKFFPISAEEKKIKKQKLSVVQEKKIFISAGIIGERKQFCFLLDAWK